MHIKEDEKTSARNGDSPAAPDKPKETPGSRHYDSDDGACGNQGECNGDEAETARKRVKPFNRLEEEGDEVEYAV